MFRPSGSSSSSHSNRHNPRNSPLFALQGTVRTCIPVVLPNCKLPNCAIKIGDTNFQGSPVSDNTTKITPRQSFSVALRKGLQIQSGTEALSDFNAILQRQLKRVSSEENVAKMSYQSMKIKRKVTVEQIRRWEESFIHLLNDPNGLTLFESYLRTEFSQENIQFWKACEQYRRLPAKELATESQNIYQLYLSVQSPKEVNLDSKTRLKTIAALSTPTQHLFDGAQKKIQALMEKDSYQRFLRSPDFLQFKHAVQSSKPDSSSMQVFGLGDKEVRALIHLTELPIGKRI